LWKTELVDSDVKFLLQEEILLEHFQRIFGLQMHVLEGTLMVNT
jgi:hypothetical protein